MWNLDIFVIRDNVFCFYVTHSKTVLHNRLGMQLRDIFIIMRNLNKDGFGWRFIVIFVTLINLVPLAHEVKNTLCWELTFGVPLFVSSILQSELKGMKNHQFPTKWITLKTFVIKQNNFKATYSNKLLKTSLWITLEVLFLSSLESIINIFNLCLEVS